VGPYVTSPHSQQYQVMCRGEANDGKRWLLAENGRLSQYVEPER
jgi:hypothetical protein